MGEASNELPPNCHPQVFLTSIAQKHNLKGIFYLDLWPVTGSMVVVNEPDLMNYISVTKSLPMHPMSEDFMTPIVGPHNIASTNGPVWKKLHNILAPAFSWSHIRNLSSVVLDETTTFRSSLDSLAESGNTFSMHETASHFIFDIIARVVYNFSLNAQRSGSQDLDDLKSLVHISQVQMGWNPIEKIKTMFLKKSLFRRIDKSVETMVKQRLEALSNDQIVPSKKNPNSILDLMLREHLEQNTSHTKGVKVTELPQEDMKLFTTK
jgi:cytochrome P450